MFKTLKSKVSTVYLFLVITIGLVGTTCIFNIYSLRKSIDGLMVNNYSSISSVSGMLETLEAQDRLITDYLYTDHINVINTFNDNSDLFNKYYNDEYDSVNEVGKKALVQSINVQYDEYINLFSRLRELKSSGAADSAEKLYITSLSPAFEKIKSELKQLSQMNEKAMFTNKDAVISYTNKSMYAILTLSLIAVVGGFILSRYSINKTLRPIYALTETVKRVKEGHLAQELPILTRDEIGELTIEFNKMTKRLQELEQSNLGKLLLEKTRSVAIVKSISDPLIVLDNNYRILLLNKSCEKLFNIEEKSAVNKYFLDVIDNVEMFDLIYNLSNTEGNKPEQKIIHLNVENNDYYFIVVVTLIKDSEASINGVVVLLQNVTQLKLLEKVKSDFISTISHEFKTPLTSIMIGTSLILNEDIGPLNKKQEQIIETIKDDGEKLTSLVTNLLQLSKLESHQSAFNIKPSSVIGLIDNSIKHFYDQAIAKEVSLYYEAEEDLPKIQVDTEKVSWVLNNLISNALKYTNSGDEIVIRPFVRENKMCVSVIDTGIGIPEDYLNKIFDRFVQVENQDSETKGSGLGLAIAKEIIEAHGGEIWCQSKLDLGSTFTFTLPLAK